LHFTQEELQELQSQFRCKQRNQIALLVMLGLAFLVLAVGFRTWGSWSLVPLLVAVVAGGASVYNWRCPACRFPLPRGMSPDRCLQCKLPLTAGVGGSHDMTSLGNGSDLEAPGGELRCSFCNKSQREVRKLIAGPHVYICDECVDICCDILAEGIEPESHMTTTRDDSSLGVVVTCSLCGRRVDSKECAAIPDRGWLCRVCTAIIRQVTDSEGGGA